MRLCTSLAGERGNGVREEERAVALGFGPYHVVLRVKACALGGNPKCSRARL